MADSEEEAGKQGDPSTDEKKDDGKQGEPFDEARARATIEAQRKAERDAKAAAKAAEDRATAAEKRLKDIEDAQKSDLEKAQGRVAELEKQAAETALQLAENNIRDAIKDAASKANAVNPGAVVKLIDRSALVITDGVVTNAEQAVADLLKAEPYLVKSEVNGTHIPGTPKPGKPATAAEVIANTRKEMADSGAYRL